MSNRNMRMGLTLRPQVHPPSSIVELSRILDEIPWVSNVFVPDIPGGFESIEICSASLGVSHRLRIGSGVIRLLEHDESILQRRLETLQTISQNRFVLGVGTGSPGNNPAQTIESMIKRLENIKKNFGKMSNASDITLPDSYIATLRTRIAKRVAGHSTGILLNFCSAEYAARLIKEVSSSTSGKEVDYACYLKVFFSRNQTVADRLLVEEFGKYDLSKQYHEMFVQDGVDGAIREATSHMETRGEAKVPNSLLKISLSNPSDEQLREYVKEFREAGITLPCVYPYFSTNEDQGYRTETVRRIAKSLG